MPSALRTVAVVAYEGVLADETAAFVDVLSRLPGARLVTVGSHLGVVGGPGGAQLIEARFEEVDPDVIVVPGGLGSHRHAEIAVWVRRVRPRWVLASSTGSALLAAGGLLRGRRAATHWLAGPLLERYGAVAATDRLVVDVPFVTCAGLATTFDAADVVVRAVGGDELVRTIHEDMRTAALHEAPACPPARTRYRARAQARRNRPAREITAPLVSAGTTVEVELEDAPVARRRH
jgi:transcriptional regulator GlxA family with amidase domain